MAHNCIEHTTGVHDEELSGKLVQQQQLFDYYA
jgi:hypothetical protein